MKKVAWNSACKKTFEFWSLSYLINLSHIYLVALVLMSNLSSSSWSRKLEFWETLHRALQLWPKHLTRPIRSVSEISFSSMLVSHRKNPWNQTLGNFWENSILIFCNVKNLPIFANFEPFFPSNSILLIFWIEWMFPKCSQILVQDFRHQNFGIWIILGWVMAIFVKKPSLFVCTTLYSQNEL